MARQDIENLESGLVVRQKINNMFIELYALIGSGAGSSSNTSNNVVTFWNEPAGNVINIYRNNNIGIEIGDIVKIYSGIDESDLIFSSTITEIQDFGSWEERIEVDISSISIEYNTQYRLKVYRGNVCFGISEIYLINS